MAEKRRKIWPNVVLLACSIGLMLGLFEAVARHLMPLDPYEIVPAEPGSEPIGIRHPTRGHSLRPNFLGHFVHPDFAGGKVATNSWGFRGAEPPAEQDVTALNVTVLGDSVTFGTGVEDGETFSALLEPSLTNRLGRPVRVFNTGVAGYGPLHELVVLREEAARQSPNIAVVGFYTGNDVQDIYNFYQEHNAIVDLLPHFMTATTVSKRRVGRNVVGIDGERRKIIAAHPDAEIRFSLRPEWIRPDARLRFGAALKPGSWGKPGADGVRFEVLVEDGEDVVSLYDEYVNPHQELALRGWNDREVDVSGVKASDTMVFRTTSGPTGSLEYDWAVWASPHIFYHDAVDVLKGDWLQSHLLLKPAFKKYWKRVVAAKAGAPSRIYLTKRSSFLRFVFGRLDHLAVRWGFKPPRSIINYYMISSFERDMSEYTRVGMDLTMRALQEMQVMMEARGGQLVVLLIPAKFQTEPETVRRFVQQAGLDPAQIDPDQPHRILLGFCARSGVTCLDLLPELRRRVESGERVYFPEGHPNRLGHEIIARQLSGAVESVVRGTT